MGKTLTPRHLLRLLAGALLFLGEPAPAALAAVARAPAKGPSTAPTPVVHRDPALLISPRALARALDKRNPPLVIDLRPAAAFDAVHIPGAINLPAFALKAKPYLVRRALVLIGQGYEYASVLPALEALRGGGVRSVRLLDGGLNAWARQGRPLQGTVFAREALGRLDPEQYLAEQHSDQWLVLKLAGILPAKLGKRFDAAIAGYCGAGTPAVLLVGREHQDPAALARRLDAQTALNLFVLEGGESALAQARERRQRLVGGPGQPHSTAEAPPACR